MRGSKKKSRESTRPPTLLCSEPDQPALANGHLVDTLSVTAIYGAGHLTYCPHYLRAVLERDAWRHFADLHTREVFEHDDFDVFARAKCPAGLGIPDGIAGLIRICEVVKGEDSDVSLRLLRGMVPAAREPHRPVREEKPNNIRLPEYGTNRTYTLARLKRDAPELADRVIAGELSAHAAAVQAGFRSRKVQVPATVEGFARAIERHLTDDDRMALLDLLRPIASGT